MGVGPWHAAGIDGSGVKIAVFDIQWFGLEQHPTLSSLSNHDCFGHRSCALPIDTLRPQFAFETGKHGIACAEVVQAIAPGAELHLVRVNGLTALENAVAWAVREEMDLVSMSMSFFSESFYDGTGSINSADALVDAGILLVNSAGITPDSTARTPSSTRMQTDATNLSGAASSCPSTCPRAVPRSP